MKRILAIIICAVMFAALAAGCGGSKPSENATGDEAYKDTYTLKKNVTEYEDSLKGLCQYFGALGYINPIETDNNKTLGLYSNMRGELIGAKEGTGKRFLAKKTKDTTIELYEYDLNNLDAKAKEVRESVQKNNTFVNLVGETVENVYLSNNGKYLMIYNDKSSDKDEKIMKEIIDKFKTFDGKKPPENQETTAAATTAATTTAPATTAQGTTAAETTAQ